ncbi:Multidrug efflux system ATP-binding protein [subsurface metagenome]
MNVIQTYGLTKYYGKVRGVENLDLEVKPGEIFGFLGPNGAGKTTTIRLLLDLIRPTQGRAEIFGLDVRTHSLEIRQRLGNLPGDVSLYENLSGEEFLALIEKLHHNRSAKRKDELAERLDIDLSRKIRTYSKGMKQKVAIIQALMNDPELLMLDEPTSGLDPLVQREFYNLLKEEKERGKTVFLSSHILPEVERVCDRVRILRDGLLVGVENIDALKTKRVRKLELTLREEVPEERLKIPGTKLLYYRNQHVELEVYVRIGELMPKLAELPLEDIVFPEATLEDTFMKFYSEEASR